MEITELLEQVLTKELQGITISNARNKELGEKIKVRPILLRGKLHFQVTFYKGNKVIHKNYEKKKLLQEIILWMQEYFKQLQAEYGQYQSTILVSKSGKMTIKTKPSAVKKPVLLTHNRKKCYILEEGKPIPFLVDLGVMTKEGKVVHAKYDKFKQINRYLEFVDDILEKLPKDRKINILDFGCGKSYLTFALYYFLRELKGYQADIIGLDLKADVIAACNNLSEKYGYQKNLKFCVGDIAGYEGVNRVDMVVTLHACDTATDYALAKAVAWGAQVILSVPCCQHELNRQIQNELLAPVLKYGLIKERMSALLTDALRAELLEEQGYEVQILEFIDMEHTPKNILIRAVKGKDSKKKPQVNKLLQELQVNPTLAKLLQRQEKMEEKTEHEKACN
ncbi:MAG: SAM-dependent methyltransferase [Lachnospiraceae bacterium]|nr:SAM-dependent methyltransferase [Lachnospiraceae bacterium]